MYCPNDNTLQPTKIKKNNNKKQKYKKIFTLISELIKGHKFITKIYGIPLNRNLHICIILALKKVKENTRKSIRKYCHLLLE